MFQDHYPFLFCVSYVSHSLIFGAAFVKYSSIIPGAISPIWVSMVGRQIAYERALLSLVRAAAAADLIHASCESLVRGWSESFKFVGCCFVAPRSVGLLVNYTFASPNAAVHATVGRFSCCFIVWLHHFARIIITVIPRPYCRHAVGTGDTYRSRLLYRTLHV